jgi:aarF domain-containing kinase
MANGFVPLFLPPGRKGSNWSSMQRTSRLHMTTTSTTTTNTRRKRSVTDRTQEETLSLIQDVLTAVFEAGPRAGPARTLQAYRALSSTIQDFVPIFNRNPETFSAPVALRKLFERLGATYIKLGQFVASSPTLFPAEYVTEFQKCLDKTEPLEWNVIKRVIEREIGPLSRTFATIDSKPLASASIAQVHRATLRTGEQVVIKVQKPRIDESLKADLSFIYVASRILEFLQPDWERTSLSAIAGDIRSSMLQELDFLQEAKNMEEFREFLLKEKLNNVATTPRVFREFTTSKVLTMEYLDGVSLLNKEVISKITTTDPESVIVTALNVWTRSVQSMPFFHADVHAGNLLVLKDGRVGFIDFGIVGRVSPKTFQAVNELSLALALSDYKGMAEALCNMGATDDEVDIVKFGKDIEEVMKRIGMVQTDVTVMATSGGTVAGSISVDEQEITDVLLQIVRVTEDNGLKLPREFGLLVKQSLYFDRYLKILAPELDVMSDERVGGIGGMRKVIKSSPSPAEKNRSSSVVIDVDAE